MTADRYIDPDYVDVAERIRLFYEKFPDGRLVTARNGVREIADGAGGRVFVWCEARAYRTPDDPQPCCGTAWEPIPGPTPFTRDSELMNAETAAWGRAIIAAGIPSKKVASADEVKARQSQPASQEEPRTDAQNRKFRAVLDELESLPDPDNEPPAGAASWTDYAKQYTAQQFRKHSSKDLTKGEMGRLIDHLEAFTVPFG